MKQNSRLTLIMKFLFLQVVIWGVLSCSDSLSQGGSTTESTNGITTLAAFSSLDSSKASYSKIKIFKANTHPDTTGILVFESELEVDGTISFATPEEGDYYIEVYSELIGRRVAQSFESEKNYNLNTIFLDSFATIYGRIELIDKTPTKVYLPGSDKIVPTDNQGQYAFEAISPGSYDVKFESIEQAFQIAPSVADVVKLGTCDAFGDNYDRQLILEILTKNTDTILDVNTIAKFEMVGSKEILTHLNLSGLGIAPEKMDGTGIPRLSNLQPIEVDISNNGLYKIPQNWGWKWDRIERLNLSGNELLRIPFSFKDIRTMKVLDLRNNHMKIIHEDVILMQLDSIYVGNNHLVDESIEVQNWLDLYAEENWRELQSEPEP